MLSFITEQNTKANGAGSSQQMMDPGKRETGARPVRTRHCKREVCRKHPHTEEATGVCKETGKVLQYMMIRKPGNLPYADWVGTRSAPRAAPTKSEPNRRASLRKRITSNWSDYSKIGNNRSCCFVYDQ